MLRLESRKREETLKRQLDETKKRLLDEGEKREKLLDELSSLRIDLTSKNQLLKDLHQQRIGHHQTHNQNMLTSEMMIVKGDESNDLYGHNDRSDDKEADYFKRVQSPRLQSPTPTPSKNHEDSVDAPLTTAYLTGGSDSISSTPERKKRDQFDHSQSKPTSLSSSSLSPIPIITNDFNISNEREKALEEELECLKDTLIMLRRKGNQY
jgi:hypothetical protein